MQVSCKECGKHFEFKKYPSSIKKGEGKFCSRKCMGAWKHKNRSGKDAPQWRGGLITRKCEICGKEFTAKAHVEKDGFGRFCSRVCYYVWRRSLTGDKSPSWNGGKMVGICKLCGSKFLSHPGRLKGGRKKFCSRSCSSVWTVINSKKQGTSIEIKMEQELTRRGVVFKKQYPIWQAKTIPDFFIAPNICIYCDGDYWHTIKGIPQKDAQQNFMLRFLGYKVYRFWEHEINKDISKCVDDIMGGYNV